MLGFDIRPETEGLPSDPLFNQFFQSDKSAAAYEEDVGRVDLNELLLRMLSASFRWDARHGPFDDFKESLLHPLARDIPCDGRAIRLSRNLVDLVNINDSFLSPFDVIIGR